MPDFTISIDIRATPERVWSILSAIERWPQWTPTVTNIQRLDTGPLAVGARARIRQPKLPPADWQVTELDEGRSFTWVTKSPGVRVTARHRVEPIADGVRATLSLKFEGILGPIVGWMTRDLNRRYLDLEAKGLKARSESAQS